MSCSHNTKTHKRVWVLGNGPFLELGPGGGPMELAHLLFFAEPILKISVYFMQQIKSYSIFTARQTHTPPDKHFVNGPWWWSSGQHARTLHQQSEFESRWSLQFFSVKFVFEKNKNKEKEAGVGPFFQNKHFVNGNLYLSLRYIPSFVCEG